MADFRALTLRPTRYYHPPATATSPAEAAPRDPETEKLKAACDSFEALFMQQMLKQMRATVPRDGLFGGGSAEQIYTEMLDAELSKEMTAEGGLGISRLLFEYMRTAQKKEPQSKP
jgi:flagellar protein FlgJ